MLVDQLQRPIGIVDRRSDLPLVPDDARIIEEPADVVLTKVRSLSRIEVGKPRPEVLPLVENRQPGEPSLKTLQTDLLEEPLVVGDSPAPLVVVIDAVDLWLDTPPAAIEAIISSVYLHHPVEFTDNRFIKPRGRLYDRAPTPSSGT